MLVVVLFEQRARNIHHNIYARDVHNVPEIAIRINSPAAAEGGGGGGGGGGAWRTQELAAGRRNAANGSRPAQQARPILRRPTYPEKKGGWEGGGRAGVRNREREREGIAWKEGERGRDRRGRGASGGAVHALGQHEDPGQTLRLTSPGGRLTSLGGRWTTSPGGCLTSPSGRLTIIALDPSEPRPVRRGCARP
jgi:hypothetical protein